MAINNELGNIADGLIFDRTQADVDYALLCEKNNIFCEENLKGAYNISDRNRVGNAVNYLSGCLYYSGSYEVHVNIKDDWDCFDIITYYDSQKVLAALDSLKCFLPCGNIHETPLSLNSLTYQTANIIERILFDLCGVFSRIMDAWLYCGDGFASDFDAWGWQGWDDYKE